MAKNCCFGTRLMVGEKRLIGDHSGVNFSLSQET